MPYQKKLQDGAEGKDVFDTALNDPRVRGGIIGAAAPLLGLLGSRAVQRLARLSKKNRMIARKTDLKVFGAAAPLTTAGGVVLGELHRRKKK